MSLLLFASLLFGATFSMFVPHSDQDSVRIREIVKQQIFQTNSDLDARLQRLETGKVENEKRLEVMQSEIDALKLEKIHLKKEVGLLRDYIYIKNSDEDKVMTSETTHPDTENLQDTIKVSGDISNKDKKEFTHFKKHQQEDGRTAHFARSANLGSLTTYNYQNTNSMYNSENTHHVAFFAWLSVTSPVVANKAIQFLGIDINIGGAYDRNTGRFQCQKGGTYVFSWTARIHKQQYGWFETSLILNGRLVNNFVIGEGVQGYSRGSDTFIVNLKLGDEVWLTGFTEYNGHVLLARTSTFSGFKLF